MSEENKTDDKNKIIKIEENCNIEKQNSLVNRIKDLEENFINKIPSEDLKEIYLQVLKDNEEFRNKVFYEELKKFEEGE